MFLSTLNHASLLSLQDLQPENWTCVLYPGLQQGRDAGSLLEKFSLVFSLGSGELCYTSTAAACCLPREGDSQLPTTMDQRHSTSSSCCQQSTSTFFYQHIVGESLPSCDMKPALAPGSTGPFSTKIFFPGFIFFPAPCCFVCLRGGSLFSWTVEAHLLCCVLCFLSQPHNLEQGPLFFHLSLRIGKRGEIANKRKVTDTRPCKIILK